METKKQKKEINFYHTGSNFPAISITGTKCALNCKHCKTKLLERLTPATTPKKLYETCIKLNNKKTKGILLTGGCDRKAKVPLKKFLPTIKKIKKETNLLIAAHTGLINEKEAREIKKSGIDCVCIDVVGSPETTKEIYGIEITPKQYKKTLAALEKAKIKNISPHICVGLHYGKLRHEKKALEIISSIKPTNIILTGLTDQTNTPMEGIKISPQDFLQIAKETRKKFPDTPISLGCARGKGRIREEIDRLCIKIADNIAVPTKTAYIEARKNNLKINEYNTCCSFLPEEIK